MATYGQWARTRQSRRLTLVCGAEPALVRDVVRAHRDAVAGPQASLFTGDLPECELWDQVLSGPPPGGRLTVIWGSEELREPGNIAVLARAAGMDTAFAVFVFGTRDFARSEGEGRQPAAPYVTAVQAARHGQLVRCCAPGSLADQARLVMSWWPGSTQEHAYDVLGRCGGSLSRAFQACDKAVRARLQPLPVMAEVVCGETDGGFADFLIAGDRKRAMAAACQVPPAETGQVLGLLAARLEALAMIGASRRRGDDGSAAWQQDRFLYRMLAAYASQYDQDRVSRDREALAVAESAWRSGARIGVLEALAALW